MREFTLDDLRHIMRSCAGVDESVDLESDIIDVSFADLNYDSLAVLEIAGRIQQEFNVSIPDDAVLGMKTPRAMIEGVNQQLVEV
jgi:act minimal PKS acyl carrier protein